MAAAQPQRQQAQCPEQPRRRLVRRRQRILHPRRVYWERRGAQEVGRGGKPPLQGRVDELWLFHRQAWIGMESGVNVMFFLGL